MSPMWRDPDGTVHYGPGPERWSERLIREAHERGEFDALPHHGKRLPLQDETYAGEQALAFHVLKNAGVAPPWIEADKELRALLQERDRLFERATGASSIAAALHRRRLREIVARANDAIATINADAPASIRRQRLVLERELEELERRISGAPDRA